MNILCSECGEHFDASAKAQVGDQTPLHGSIEVTTNCTHCGAGYLTFIEPEEWTRDRDNDSEVAA